MLENLLQRLWQAGMVKFGGLLRLNTYIGGGIPPQQVYGWIQLGKMVAPVSME